MSKPDQQHSPENLAFAAELVKARGDLGLTQSQLSADSGVSLSAIKGYETGRNMPGGRELRDLCRVLRVTPNKLLYGVENPFPPLHADDPARVEGDKGKKVHRNRISFLANMLTFDESYAVYSLIHSIAVARFGEAEVRANLETADLMTVFQIASESGAIEKDLFPKDPELLRALGDGILKAVRTGEKTEINLETGERGLKVSKK